MARDGGQKHPKRVRFKNRVRHGVGYNHRTRVFLLDKLCLKATQVSPSGESL